MTAPRTNISILLYPRTFFSTEKSLNYFVQQHAEEKPSTDFSTNLMSQLEGMSPKKPYEPVISARIWIGLTSIISALLSIVFITSESESTSDKFSFKLYQIHFDLAGKFESNVLAARILRNAGFVRN